MSGGRGALDKNPTTNKRQSRIIERLKEKQEKARPCSVPLTVSELSSSLMKQTMECVNRAIH